MVHRCAGPRAGQLGTQQVSAVPPLAYTAQRLGRDVRLGSRRFAESYGPIAYAVCWWQAPRDPAEKFSLLIENLFCRAVMSINNAWRVRLDRSETDAITGILLIAPGRLAVYPVKFSSKLLRIWDPDGKAFEPLSLQDGGGPIIDCVAALCAEFFGDENAHMSYAGPRPILDIADAS